MSNDYHPVEITIIDGLCLLKIMKHSNENTNTIVTGKLLGLDLDSKVEVTNIIPMPAEVDENYELEMMKLMRSLNHDYVNVGWYQTVSYNNFSNESTIAIQYAHQSEISNSIMLIYDPQSSASGVISIKAFRLTDKFMKFYSEDIFEPIPIEVTNSLYIAGLVFDLTPAPLPPCLSLKTNTTTTLTKTLSLLTESIEDFSREQTAFSGFLRSQQRQVQQQQYAAKKRAEKSRNAGEPEAEEESRPSRAHAGPSRMERMFVAGQMAHLCDSITE